MRDKKETLEKIRRIADYQLGEGSGVTLFPNNVKIAFSRTSGRIRYVHLAGKLLATLRPTDGMFSLTIRGGERLIREKSTHLWVKLSEEAAAFVVKGKSAFAKHVINAHLGIRPEEEVLLLGKGDTVLAVGKALLTEREMKLFKKGLAVRVRKGLAET